MSELKVGQSRMTKESWCYLVGYFIVVLTISAIAFFVLPIKTDMPKGERWTKVVEVVSDDSCVPIH